MDNRGLVVDDYTLRKYERRRSWGPSVYGRLAGGLSRIEGKRKIEDNDRRFGDRCYDRRSEFTKVDEDLRTMFSAACILGIDSALE